MEFSQQIKMSIEDWRLFENDEDYEFAYGTVDFLSNRPNSHKHNYSEDVIRQYAPTVINKWVIADYDPLINDATTHTSQQVIVGRVPEQEIKYRYDSNGYLIASVDVIISKLYATEVYNLFRNINHRAVSIEELVGFTEETEQLQDGMYDKEVVGFNITGITILGLGVKPSVPNANMYLTQMSEDSLDKAENEYRQFVKYNHFTTKDIIDKLDIIVNELSNLKEETMAEIKIEDMTVEEVVNSDVEQVITDETVKNSEQEAEVVENECTEQNACNTEQNACDTEQNSCEVEQNACGDVEKMSEKIASMEAELVQAKDTISKYETQIAELTQFKTEVEMSKKNEIISETLSKVKEFVDETTYASYAEKATECEYSMINVWKNEVLASIADKALIKMSQLSAKEDGITDIGMPIVTETKTSIYD